MSKREFEGPRWKSLSLDVLRRSSKTILSREPAERTLKAAYREVLQALEASGAELRFRCGRCNSPVSAELPRCWACGAVLEEEVETDRMVEEEVKRRAQRLGIPTRDKMPEQLRGEVEAAEARRRTKVKDADLTRIEFRTLKARFIKEMPDGWFVKENVPSKYCSFRDHGGVGRIILFYRGLRVGFATDGEAEFLRDVPGMMFYDEAERKRRHFGRMEWVYQGDVSKEALDAALRVMLHFDRKPKKSRKAGKR